jgi:pyruvate-ferredoxin/flavodoxin oxidoreductase
MSRRRITVDGNEAAASVAHRLSEVICIYPITPSSPMGEFSDEWSSYQKTNIWGQVPDVVAMQSEAGAAGSVHGVLQAGALSTTFTASQGLLLMIPNMYKIAGELQPFVMHVTARTLATHALSIFGDHSDVMACRQTGFTMLCSNSVQEAHDFALIAHAATLRTRLPILHFFDGFRTSHEVAKIEELTDDDLRAMIDDQIIADYRSRALTPDRPVIRGTAQNPDTFFQAREACNPFHAAVPAAIQAEMDRFAKLTGRQYHIFDYVGAPDAQRVIVMMGSGAETAEEAVERLTSGGEKVGLLKCRLYRPFDVDAFVKALPKTVKQIAVLDRTKEPGATGEPLYLDVVTSLVEHHIKTSVSLAQLPGVVGGRYGLSSKEFTPAMVKAVFDNLNTSGGPKNHFTIGILDDVSHTSLPFDASFDVEPASVSRCLFVGLGADGTVGANKNSIKIIGEETDNFAQGYFVYDSKKSGSMTISHLRFGPKPIRSQYLITKASFVACSQFGFMDSFDVLQFADQGATFLLNAPYAADVIWDKLPRDAQQQIIDKRLKFYVIDAVDVAGKTGMGRRTNTVMQTAFFAISGVLPRADAIEQIKKSIKKTYGKKGEEVVRRNYEAVDMALSHLHEVKVPASATATKQRKPIVPDDAPDFVKAVSAIMMAGQGDILPVSAFRPDGTWPTATTQWEKRNIALEVPVWDESVCIQCNKCALVCPHAAIRAKVYDGHVLESNGTPGAPDSFRSTDYKAPDFKGLKFTIQVAPEDCTGCGLCVNVCPAKNKTEPRLKAINMTSHDDVLAAEKANYDFFLDIPEVDRSAIKRMDVKGSQFLLPLFEYSGACAGCGETPYVKLMTQLFGDRLLVANATGCSSIYGGNLPTTPYCTNADGRGPAWANSLFEDNAEFGFGMRLAVDYHTHFAQALLKQLAAKLGDDAVKTILDADQSTEAGLASQRQRVANLKAKLATMSDPIAQRLLLQADYLVKKSVWLVGGDGWAYDIGYGGLDHVLAQPRNINILVLDTEVYSNTGGQASKSTPVGAAAKFAASGKAIHKKDLGLMAMNYGHVYVASIAMGANDAQTVKTFLEAESYEGPSLIIAYSHCIAHGYDLQFGMDQQTRAVQSGIWPLYRFDPRRSALGEPALQLDSKPVKLPVSEYMRNETRFRMVEKINPQRFALLAKEAQKHASQRVALYEQLSAIKLPVDPAVPAAPAAPPAKD